MNRNMEMEFDVQMTSGDLYDYMLHHTYGSASGLIGSVAGALMVVDEGLEVSQGEETQSQKWEDIHKAISTTKSIIVYTTAVNASIFPRRELGDKEQGVIKMISTHMPPKKVKIRC